MFRSRYEKKMNNRLNLFHSRVDVGQRCEIGCVGVQKHHNRRKLGSFQCILLCTGFFMLKNDKELFRACLKTSFKKLLAMFLALALIASIVPLYMVFASDAEAAFSAFEVNNAGAAWPSGGRTSNNSSTHCIFTRTELLHLAQPHIYKICIGMWIASINNKNAVKEGSCHETKSYCF